MWEGSEEGGCGKEVSRRVWVGIEVGEEGGVP